MSVGLFIQRYAKRQRREELTAAYAIATFVKVAGVSHQVALQKPKTRRQPMSPTIATPGCSQSNNVVARYSSESRLNSG